MIFFSTAISNDDTNSNNMIFSFCFCLCSICSLTTAHFSRLFSYQHISFHFNSNLNSTLNSVFCSSYLLFLCTYFLGLNWYSMLSFYVIIHIDHLYSFFHTQFMILCWCAGLFLFSLQISIEDGWNKWTVFRGNYNSPRYSLPHHPAAWCIQYECF